MERIPSNRAPGLETRPANQIESDPQTVYKSLKEEWITGGRGERLTTALEKATSVDEVVAAVKSDAVPDPIGNIAGKGNLMIYAGTWMPINYGSPAPELEVIPNIKQYAKPGPDTERIGDYLPDNIKNAVLRVKS